MNALLTSLRIIAQIKEGQKVCIRNGTVILETQSTGIITGIRRWIHNDNRQSTSNFLVKLLYDAMEMAEHHNDVQVVVKLRMAIHGALIGIRNIMVTYADDANIVAILQVLSEHVLEFIKNDVLPIPPQNNKKDTHK